MMHEQDSQILPPVDSNDVVSARLRQSIEHDLSSLVRPKSMPSIRRVPRELRQGNESHFTPTAISIGPLHASSERLKDGEELKKRFLASFLSRFDDESILSHLICLLLSLERRAGLSYADDFENLGSEEFVKMMLLDGCFIVELVLRMESCTLINVEDPILVGRATGPLLYITLQDLLLLENQVPFFILQALYDVFRYQPNSRQSILTVAPILFWYAYPLFCFSVDAKNYPSHLLELMLFALFPRAVGHENAKKTSCPSRGYMRSASDLALHGIKFAESRFTDSMENVSFCKGVLKMPCLDIQESSAFLFKNLLALEQCSSQKYNGFFTSFLILMDTLIDTERYDCL